MFGDSSTNCSSTSSDDYGDDFSLAWRNKFGECKEDGTIEHIENASIPKERTILPVQVLRLGAVSILYNQL